MLYDYICMLEIYPTQTRLNVLLWKSDNWFVNPPRQGLPAATYRGYVGHKECWSSTGWQLEYVATLAHNVHVREHEFDVTLIEYAATLAHVVHVREHKFDVSFM